MYSKVYATFIQDYVNSLKVQPDKTKVTMRNYPTI